MLGQGDRALILNLDSKDYLLYLEKIQELFLQKIKSANNIKRNTLDKVFEKRLMDEKN